MFILTMKEDDKAAEGAYAVITEHGEKVLQLFQNEDDAVRYMGLLDASNYGKPLELMNIDVDAVAINCEKFGYTYAIVSKNDLVVPPIK